MRAATLFLLIVGVSGASGASNQSLRGSGEVSRRLMDAAETTALKTMFDLADTNKDGLVSFPELLMMYPAAAAAAPVVAAPVAPPVFAAPAAASAVAAPAAIPAVAVAAPAVVTAAVAAPAVAPEAAATAPAAEAGVEEKEEVKEPEKPAEPEAVQLATEAAKANMEAAIKSGTVEHIEDEEVVGVLSE